MEAFFQRLIDHRHHAHRPSQRRYCQELCSEECGSGGVSELKDTVGEDLSLEEGEDEFW